jgi:RHS repeat-associated protein
MFIRSSRRAIARSAGKGDLTVEILGGVRDPRRAETATYPSTITYAGGKYRVRFGLVSRGDYISSWDTDSGFHTFEKSRLGNIYVEQDVDVNGTFETIRRYDLAYKADTDSDIIFPGYLWLGTNRKTSTLASVKEYGVNGASNLPTTTFTYGDNLHLTHVSNGYGGAVDLTYDTNPWFYEPYAPEYHINSHTWDCYSNGGLTARPGGSIDCEDNSNSSNRIIVRGVVYDSQFSTYGSKANLIRPGGVYKLSVFGKSVDPGSTLKLGLTDRIDGTTDNYFSLSTTSSVFKLPATANQVVPLINVSGGGHAHLAGFRLELLTSVYRVTQKSISDGNGPPYTSSFAYSGAAVNDATTSPAGVCGFTVDGEGKITDTEDCYEYFPRFSEFRGHAGVTETGPDGTKTTTTFNQSDSLKGRPISVITNDGVHNLTATSYSYTSQSLSLGYYSHSKNGYSDDGCYTHPCAYIGITHYWVHESSVDNDLFANDGNIADGTKTLYSYDDTYGNLVRREDYYKYKLYWYMYPYRITEYSYYPNLTNYLVGLPARQAISDQNWAVIAETLYLYDGANSYTTTPVAGKLTAMRTWASGADYSQETYAYDTRGNRIKVTTYSGYGTATSAPTVGPRNFYTCYGGGYTLGGLTCADEGTYALPLWTENFLAHKTSWTYDYTKGVPLTETDPNGNITSAEYDAFGRLTKLIRPGDDSPNPTISITYTNSFPFTTTIQQKIDNTPRYYTVQRVYDGMGRQKQITSGGTTVDTIYQSATVTKQSVPYQGTSPNLFTTTSINPSARTTTVQAPDGTSTVTATNGLVTTVTDANQHITTSIKDIWGRVTLVQPPGGPSVSYGYDELDHLKTATRGGVTTTLTYDYAGRKISMSDPDMGTWSYGYDAIGSLIRQTDARGQRICLYYDSLNRLIGKHYRGDDNCPDSPGYDVSYGYDAGTNGKGRRTSMSSTSNGQTVTNSWAYDTRGRVTSETVNPGTAYTTQWEYNSADLPTLMKYPVDNEQVNYTYDNRMLLYSVIGASTYVASTTYDMAGRIDVRAFGNNTQTDSDYFAWGTQGGRLQNLKSGTTNNPPNPTSLQNLTYSYDPVGNVSTILDSLAGPQTQSFTYDALDRLWGASATGGANGLYNEKYGYDATTGNSALKDPTPSLPPAPNPGMTGLVSWWNMNESSGTRSDSHSSNHLSDNNTVGSTTGKQGNAAQFILANSEYLSIPDNASVSMGSGARMTVCAWVKLNSKSVSGVQNIVSKRGLSNGSWEYFLRYDGRVDRFVYLATSDGYAATLAEVKADAFGPPTTNTWYFVCGGYDGINAWISVNAGTRNTVPFSTDIFDGTNTLRFGSGYPGGSSPEYLDGMVDELVLYKRALNTSEIGWLYNAGAGRTYTELTPLSAGTLTYTYGDAAHAHAVTHINGVQKYWYDANGNQTKRILGADTYDLAYDAENRLTQVKKNYTLMASFVYDGDGNRVQSTVNGTLTTFIGGYYEVTGSTVTKYYFAGATRVAMRKYLIPQYDTLTYLLGDHLGSTSLAVTGSEVIETRYKPWGEVRSTTPSKTLPTRYTYTGQYSHVSDEATDLGSAGFGLLFYNARMYDPALGRFTSADTIVPGGVQGLDRYAYVNNNPMRFTDPSGHKCVGKGEECENDDGNPINGAGGWDFRLSKLAQKLIGFSRSVGRTPEEVIGIGLGHEMFYETKDEQAIHEQAFRDGFIQYADANCYGKRTHNCMLNYFSSLQSVKGQFTIKPKDYDFIQVDGNLDPNLKDTVTAGIDFMKDFMNTISQYRYDPAGHDEDMELPVNTGVIYVKDFNALNMGPPTAEMGFLIVKPGYCPKGAGYSLIYNWHGQDLLDDYGITACQ